MSSTQRPSPAPLSGLATPGRSSARPAPQAAWLAGAPSPALDAAVRRVLVAWGSECGEAGPAAAAADVLAALATTVHRRRENPDAPIEARARSALGQRLLGRLRAEVIAVWAEGGATHADALAILTAIERVREAIEPDVRGGGGFPWPVSGSDGLELLVDIVHDLRSPLTSILFLAETLQRGQSGPVTDVQRRQLGLIYSAALGLSSVASDIIELARGGAELVENAPVPFSVGAILESVSDIVRPIAEEKQLTVRLLPPTADERIGHPVALSRVLLNLTTNALKFTDQGFVEILTREAGTTRVEFAVRDSGRGIDPAVLTTLYRPLRQVVGGSGRVFSSTGLGLTMCRRLVEAMGSELKVESRAGWGTRFFFELDLPLCPRAGARGAHEPLRPTA